MYSISKVNLEFRLCDAETRILENVNVAWKNLPSKLKFEILDANNAHTNIILTGSKENIESITADDVEAYVDMNGVKVGNVTLDIICEGNNPFVKYTSETETIEFNIVQ